MARWDRVLIRESDSDRSTNLSARVEALIARQEVEWPLLRDALGRLSQSRRKTIDLNGFPIQLHCHPHRIESTTARVDEDAVRRRACKLCAEQLLEHQEGVAHGDHFIVLCNPYPVLERHLTIVDRVHVRQAIAGRLPSLLELAEALGGTFVVFYNGPQCGASTPEHFHVQAVPCSGVPILDHLAMIERNAAQSARKEWIAGYKESEAFTLENYYVRLIVFRGHEPVALSEHVQHTLDQFAGLTGTSREPLVNLLITFDRPGWSVFLFPRSRHRPTCYLDGTFTVSPASLDMAGCFVVPIEEHYDRLGAEQLAQVFTEVTLGPELFGRLVASLAR